MYKKVIEIIIIFFLINTTISFGTELELELNSKSAILIDELSGKVLYEKDAYSLRYPASITKIITAILAIENLDFEKEIIVGDEINYVAGNASKIYLKIGDKIKVKDLIASLILRSANDGSYVLAKEVIRTITNDPEIKSSDAIRKFVDMMNNKAAEIGALNTKFKNPDGYHIDGHYSNAYDLALIAGFAMKNEYFRNLVSIEQYESEYSNSIWENRNLLLDQNSEYFYEYATGIKTGHTGEAGYTLASSATNNNINLIAITLLGDEDKIRWEDTIKLFDYGFTNFTLHEFNYVNKVVDNVKTSKRYSPFKDSLEVITLENAQKVISKDESEKIETKIQYNDDIVKTNNEEIVLKSPIKKGQILGEISYSIDGKIISSSQLIASSDSGLLNKFEEKLYMFDDWVKSNFVIFSFSMVIVMYFLYFIIKKWKSKRRRKRRLF